MLGPLVITGTDTGIGKTIFAAGLMGFLKASYWKPIQAGLEEKTDTDTMSELAHPCGHLIPEAYRLRVSASPHFSAQQEGASIDPWSLQIPSLPSGKTLLIEGAGGLMVPLTSEILFIDVFAMWQAPVILCASTTLGTINHTLLSIEALRQRHIPILGIAFIGPPMGDTERIIEAYTQVPILGRLPWLDPLTKESLAHAFAMHFRHENFHPSPTSS